MCRHVGSVDFLSDWSKVTRNIVILKTVFKVWKLLLVYHALHMNIPFWIKRKRFIIPVVVVLIAAFIANSWLNSKSRKDDIDTNVPNSVSVIVAKKKKSIESETRISGIIMPKEYTQIVAKLNANVRYMAPVGAKIKSGQTIVEMYDNAIIQTYNQAKDAVRVAKQNLDETIRLNDEMIIQAKLNVDSAKVSFDTAENSFENTQLLNDRNLSATLDSAEVAYESAYNLIERIILFWGDGGSLNEFILRDTPNGNLALLNSTTNDFELLKDVYLSLSQSVKGDVSKSLIEMESALVVARNFNNNVFRTLSYGIAIPALGFPQSKIDEYTRQSALFIDLVNAQNTAIKSAKNSVSSIDVTIQGSYILSKDNLDQAKIRLSNAQSAFESVLRQTDIQTLSARNRLTNANIQLANAQSAYFDLSPKAPFDGVIIANLANIGDQVSPGSKLVEIGRVDAVEISLSADESQGMFINQGKSVIVNDNMEGTITEVSPTASIATGKIDFVVSVDNPDGVLNPGDVGEVTISQTIPVENKIVIPLSNVTVGQDEIFVLTAEKSEEENEFRVKKQPVVLGDVIDNYVIVESGVDEGDLIIKDGGEFLGVGDAVTVELQ